MKSKIVFVFACVLILLSMASLQIGSSLDYLRQWQLISAPGLAQDFADIHFLYAQLPRYVVTLLVGGCLGVGVGVGG